METNSNQGSQYTRHKDMLIDKMNDCRPEQSMFLIDIKHNPHTGSFLINFNTDEKYLVSVKVTEGQAISIARDLGLKIMEG